MSLRAPVLRGGAYLAGREALGIVVRLLGILALTRLLAPAEFGVYAGVAAIVTVLAHMAQFGTEIFLTRREEEPSERLYDETFTFVAASTLAIAGLALVASVVVEAWQGPPPGSTRSA